MDETRRAIDELNRRIAVVEQRYTHLIVAAELLRRAVGGLPVDRDQLMAASDYVCEVYYGSSSSLVVARSSMRS